MSKPDEVLLDEILNRVRHEVSSINLSMKEQFRQQLEAERSDRLAALEDVRTEWTSVRDEVRSLQGRLDHSSNTFAHHRKEIESQLIQLKDYIRDSVSVSSNLTDRISLLQGDVTDLKTSSMNDTCGSNVQPFADAAAIWAELIAEKKLREEMSSQMRDIFEQQRQQLEVNEMCTEMTRAFDTFRGDCMQRLETVEAAPLGQGDDFFDGPLIGARRRDASLGAETHVTLADCQPQPQAQLPRSLRHSLSGSALVPTGKVTPGFPHHPAMPESVYHGYSPAKTPESVYRQVRRQAPLTGRVGPASDRPNGVSESSRSSLKMPLTARGHRAASPPAPPASITTPTTVLVKNHSSASLMAPSGPPNGHSTGGMSRYSHVNRRQGPNSCNIPVATSAAADRALAGTPGPVRGAGSPLVMTRDTLKAMGSPMPGLREAMVVAEREQLINAYHDGTDSCHS